MSPATSPQLPGLISLCSRPSSRTWPLGLVLFYLGRYEEAAVRLDTDIRYFETQFEECATDERIWQAAAMIRGAREAGADVEQVAAGLPPLQIPERNALRRTVYRVRLFRVYMLLVLLVSRSVSVIGGYYVMFLPGGHF